ncbi:MAG: metallophosphoesterase family protein [Bacillota bacterium]
MKLLKFLHFSDLHLDMPFTSMGPGSKRAASRRQDLLDVFDSIVSLAQKEAVDVILISGDLYEHNYIKKSTISYINKKFSGINPIKIFIVPGNHDPYINNSYYKNFEWSSNVFILSQDRPYVVLEDISACIYGIGFSNFYEEKLDLTNIKSTDNKLFNLMLIHGTVDMNFGNNMYNPVASAELAGLSMDYIALGHFHNRMDNIGRRGVIYNPGSPEPLGFDEEGEHGIYLGTIEKISESDKKLSVSFIPTGKKQYISLEIRSDAFCSNQEVIDRINNITGDIKGTGYMVSVTLKGYVEPGYRVNTAKIINLLNNSFFYIDVKDETLPLYNYGELANDPGIKGIFVKKMLTLINNAGSEKERHLLRKSLYYGIEALEQGRVEIV